MTSQLLKTYGQVVAILGCQWGDEGKGKLVDMLSEEYDLIVRAGGGANAGHTIYVTKNGQVQKIVFRLVPSGVLHAHTICLIGNGCVVHLPSLFEEIAELKKLEVDITGRLFISDRAHLLFDYHKIIDGLQEDQKAGAKVGTTKRGIGPCYADKVNRIGIRVGELADFKEFTKRLKNNLGLLKKMYGDFPYDLDKETELYRNLNDQIRPLICDGAWLINEKLAIGKSMLLEGANGMMLDIDHGTYPFVTSSNPTIGGLFTGSGLAPQKLNQAIGILKAYTTRVGGGPFPTELLDETGEKLRQTGGEYGSVTGRPRRCGWFDAVQSRYALQINGIQSINLTKLDVLSGLEAIKIGVNYQINGQKVQTPPSLLKNYENLTVEYIELPGWTEDISQIKKFADLPKNCQAYVEKIEELIKCPITFIGVGQKREQMIIKD